MKKSSLFGFFILTILSLVYDLGFSQTKAEDSNYVVSLKYVGYENGEYVISVTSNTVCTLSGDLTINSANDTTFKVTDVAAKTSKIFKFAAPPGATIIKFQPSNSECLCGDLSKFNAEICIITALPITLSEFTARRIGEDVNLKWTTQTESLNDHFDVEFSKDGINFEKMAEVKSKAKDGNSSMPLNYSVSLSTKGKVLMGFSMFGFLGLVLTNNKKRKLFKIMPLIMILGLIFSLNACKKENPLSNSSNPNFVRLAQVDKDGSITYSKVIRLNF